MVIVGGAVRFGYKISLLNAPIEEILLNLCENSDDTTKSCGEEKRRLTIYVVVTSVRRHRTAPIRQEKRAILQRRLLTPCRRLIRRPAPLGCWSTEGSSSACTWALPPASCLHQRDFVKAVAGDDRGLNQLFMTIDFSSPKFSASNFRLGGFGLRPLLLALTFVPSLYLLVGGSFMPSWPRTAS